MELKDVVIKAQSGDKKAFTELFEHTQKMVYFTALKITGNESVAEDMTQEVYLKAMEKLSTLQTPEAFVGWLRQITVNTCKNYLAAKKPFALGENEDDEIMANLPEVDENFIPHEYADNRETCRIIMKMVDSLPESQRAAVIMYYYNELPISRIAELLEVSENTVKSRLNYARRQIKEQVEDLEKKGTKLHAVPVLGLVMHRAAEEFTLSAAAKTAITSAIAAKTIAAATTTATTAATVATAKVAASGGILAKIAAWPIATKIIAGVLSAGVAVGAGFGVAKLASDDGKKGSNSFGGSDDTVEVGDAAIEIDITEVDDAFVNKYKNYDVSELFALTKDEIKAEFGDRYFEDRNCIYYWFSTDGVQDLSSLAFLFDEEAVESEFPIDINVSGSLFDYKGVKTGISRDEAADLLENEEFVLEKEDELCDLYALEDSDIFLTVFHDDGIVTDIHLGRAYEIDSDYVPDDGEIVSTVAGEEIPTLEGIEEMLGLTKDQVFSRWGETFYDEEDARAQYTVDGEALSIYFENSVVSCIDICSYRSVFGIDQGMTDEEMLETLRATEEIVYMEEYNKALKYFDVYSKNARYHFYCSNDDYYYRCMIYPGGYEAPEVIGAFLRDISVGNGVKDNDHIPLVKLYSDGKCTFKLNDYNGMVVLEGTYAETVSGGTTTYTFDMKGIEYFKGGRFKLVHTNGSNTATFYTIGGANFGTTYDGDLFKAYLGMDAAETIEKFEADIEANHKAQKELISYWENNLKADGGFYAFADVTHDGIDELFNLVKKHDYDYDTDYAYFYIYTLKDGEVVEIDSGYYTQNPSVFEYYHLYYENEKAYIIYRYYTGRQGGVSSFYNIYSLDQSGNKIMLRNEDFSGLWDDLTDAEYDRIDEIEENYQSYVNKSSTIIAEFYGVLNVGGWW